MCLKKKKNLRRIFRSLKPESSQILSELKKFKKFSKRVETVFETLSYVKVRFKAAFGFSIFLKGSCHLHRNIFVILIEE